MKAMVEDQAPTRKRSRWCYGLMCCLGMLLIKVILVVILIFTVFKVKEPTVTLNNITLNTTQLGGLAIGSGSNISMTADASVYNPNVGTFRFGNTTSNIFYKGIVVGQGTGPTGHARARRALRMNLTVELMIVTLLKAPNLSDDIASGVLTMDSYTRVPGKVKVLFVVRKVVVEMNCSVAFNITSQKIQDQKCNSHVDL